MVSGGIEVGVAHFVKVFRIAITKHVTLNEWSVLGTFLHPGSPYLLNLRKHGCDEDVICELVMQIVESNFQIMLKALTNNDIKKRGQTKARLHEYVLALGADVIVRNPPTHGFA